MLVVEDGTVVDGANSYVTLDEADTYFEERAIDEWLVNEDENEAMLIRAGDFLNTMFTVKGDRIYGTQSMALPTLAWDGIPYPFKRAQFILALEAKKGNLVPSVSGPILESERKKLDGVGEKEFKYAAGTSAATRIFPEVVALLSPYVTFQAGGSIQSARRYYG